MKDFSYTLKGVPQNYQCSKCGRAGIKLWRQYQTLASCVDLLCVDCSLKDQGVNYEVDNEGYHNSDLGLCDQIEWLVPAIPTEDNRTFWGYTSVPEVGVIWWRRLPLRPTANKPLQPTD